MTLKQILQQNINSYTEIDHIYKIVTDIKHYKIGTIDRCLRQLTEEKLIKPIFKKNYIIGYEPLTIQPTICSSQRPKTAPGEELDQKLKYILSSIKPTWENAKTIAIINKIIKSKSSYNKEQLIKHYEQK